MKKEIADKWVAALRSGEYKQREGGLANEKRTKHCCLGVLCELAIKEGVEMLVEVRPDMPKDMYFEDSAGGLPYSVQEWAGVASANGRLYGGISVATLNDDMKYDFGRIANIIEESWKEL